MASEELQQKYPNNEGQKIGRYEVFEVQLVTLQQFGEHGIIPNKDYGTYKTQKCDTLIITRIPYARAVAVGEHKKPGGITEKNWKAIAKDLLTNKCHRIDAIIGYVTDGTNTYWINGQASDVLEVIRDDGNAMPKKIDFNDAAFVTELNHILNNFDPVTNRVKDKTRTSPNALAKEVWQTVWRLHADRPEDCLATFVELFVYKFLDDLGLMKINSDGVPVDLATLMKLPKDKSLIYYEKQIRPYIKELFPSGSDGYSIINGTVLQSANRDHNLIFHELMRKFIKFGSLKNTDPEFKMRLYESFLQESKTTTSFGQFFTPRKVVSAIHDMAQVAKLAHGKEICDPASGVAGFILEQMARDLASQWVLKGDEMIPAHKWHAYDTIAKTTILAKANALVHCGDFLADQPQRVPSFAKWLNEVFLCYEKTSLGSLETMYDVKFDLIMTNPPFVVSGSRDISKLITSNNKRKTYFGIKYSGVEGLFVQYVVKSLKPNGDAWILLPETFFLRTTDKSLRTWLLEMCEVDLLAILPERTFFNTPKRVIVVHLKKRIAPLSSTNALSQLKKEKSLIFAVSEIGETRDAKRFPCETDLPQLVECYKIHSVGASIPKEIKRATVTSTSELYGKASLNLRHFWDKGIAKELGLLGADEDPVEARQELDSRVKNLETIVKEWKENYLARSAPRTPANWKTVRLGDEDIFSLSIGRRVLKKEVYENRTGVPLYSANVRVPFGYVHAANAGDLNYGGALWSIDSDFDCRGVAVGEQYSITDHCGQIEILVPTIDPHYLARQVKQSGLNQGFNRDYRPSLGVIKDLEIDLPVDENGDFDLALMQEWTSFQEEIDRTNDEISKLLSE